MFYETRENKHGLRHDPFKALAVPRPIGWVSTVDKNGICNLAPYSFFNAVGEKPPYVIFSSAGAKDSLRNIAETGEFVCSLATYDLRFNMNMTSAAVPPGVDEFPIGDLTAAPSRLVKPPRVKESPAAFECRHWQTIDLPGVNPGDPSTYSVIFGRVIGIDRARVIPDPRRTLAEKPIAPWNTPAYEEHYDELWSAAKRRGVPLDVPWGELAPMDQEWVWSGEGKLTNLEKFFRWLEHRTYKVHVRVLLARYRSYTPCGSCGGTRLPRDSRCAWISRRRSQPSWRIASQRERSSAGASR